MGRGGWWRWLAGVVLLGLVGAGVWAWGRPNPRPEAAPRAEVRVPRLVPSALTIVPGVHGLCGLSPSAAYVVETSGGLILIDAGLDPDGGPLRRQMTELGLDPSRLRAILLTHAHGDHSGGAEALRRATGARVHAGRADAAVLEAGGPRAAFFSTFFMPDASTHRTNVDVPLDGGETITVGDARFQALATPGHTPGSTCYLLERGGRRILFSGDVIMSLLGDPTSHSHLARPLGTYAAYLAPRYRGDAGAFLATLRRLRALPAPDLVLPGHPGMDPTPPSPVMTRERWETLLDAGIRDMEALLARYRADGANFLDGNPKRLLPGLYYLGDFRDAAVYALAAGSELTIVAVPSGPGLADFVTARLAALGVPPMTPTTLWLTGIEPGETEGLREFVAQTGVRVVTAADGVATVRAACPPGAVVVSTPDPPAAESLDVTSVPLRGLGAAPVAYQLRRAGKTVLFTGPLPVKLEPPAMPAWVAGLGASREEIRDSLTALADLADRRPDLWLPARPRDGQNACLYDAEWDDLIAGNQKMLRFALRLGNPQSRR